MVLLPYPLLFLKKKTTCFHPPDTLKDPLCNIAPPLDQRAHPTAGNASGGLPKHLPGTQSGVSLWVGIINPIYRWESRGWAEHIPAKVPVSRTQRWDLNPQVRSGKGDPPLYRSLPKLPILNDSPFNGVCKESKNSEISF